MYLFSVGFNTVERVYRYKIVVLLFGAVYAAPKIGITILDFSFINDNSAFSQSSISEVEIWAKPKINRFSSDMVHFRNEFNF